MAAQLDPSRIYPAGLHDLIGPGARGVGSFIERIQSVRDLEERVAFCCPMTRHRVMFVVDGARHGSAGIQAATRALTHFEHRWRQAIQQLHAMGLRPPEMLHDLEILAERYQIEAQREFDLELGVGRREPDLMRHTATSLRMQQRAADRVVNLAWREMFDVDIHRLVSLHHDVTDNRRREEAEHKARELLLTCLSPAQRADFEAHGAFSVEVTDHGGMLSGWPLGTFRIDSASTFNVTHVPSSTRYCVVASDSVPIWDQMLTQKLLLENDPSAFFEVANVSSADFYSRPGQIWFVDDVNRALQPARRAGPHGERLEERSLDLSRAWRRGERRLAAVHPGWREMVATEAFRSWLRRMPPAVQRMADSDDPETAVTLLNLYLGRQPRDATQEPQSDLPPTTFRSVRERLMRAFRPR